jgi:hypothetical protein
MSYRFIVTLTLAVALCTLLKPAPATSQSISTIMSAPTPCVMSIYKMWNPNRTTPFFVQIKKILEATCICVPGPGRSAACLPAFGTARTLTAGIFGFLDPVSPSCSWSCVGCYGDHWMNITIDANDGLPVELMDFSIE